MSISNHITAFSAWLVQRQSSITEQFKRSRGDFLAVSSALGNGIALMLLTAAFFSLLAVALLIGAAFIALLFFLNALFVGLRSWPGRIIIILLVALVLAHALWG
jgi:hypothetical protein